jgi:hypothetical protein
MWSTVSYDADGMEIDIPTRHNWFFSMFTLFWLGGWGFGVFSAVRDLTTKATGGGGVFLLFWLLAWTVGGIFVIYSWFWITLGHEHITLDRTTLTIETDAVIFSSDREYIVSSIKNLRINQAALVNPYGYYSRGNSFSPNKPGIVCFDYGAKTVSFGQYLEEAEGKMIIANMNRRYPFNENEALPV